jgi:hypothetical protein
MRYLKPGPGDADAHEVMRFSREGQFGQTGDIHDK